MTLPRPRIRGLAPLALIAVWLVVGALLGPFAGRLGDVATNDQAAFLPRSAESTRVLREQAAFRQRETLPVIVVSLKHLSFQLSGTQLGITITSLVVGM
ncbi:hypothetical protein ACWDPC_28685, partial [Streptomyces misionensis]